MLAQIATIVCAAAMTLSLCVEAGSFFHQGEVSLAETTAQAPAAQAPSHESPQPHRTG